MRLKDLVPPRVSPLPSGGSSVAAGCPGNSHRAATSARLPFPHPLTEHCKRTLRFSTMFVIRHHKMRKKQLQGKLAEDDITQIVQGQGQH